VRVALLAVLLGILAVPAPRRACVLRLESPAYPAVARAARVQGDVHVRARLGRDGKATQVSATGQPLLVQEAESNLRTWTFAPGHPARVDVLYRFRLEGPDSYCSNPRVEFNLPSEVTVVSRPPTPEP
jgi:TonB family protein